jgi:hypothetical protein
MKTQQLLKHVDVIKSSLTSEEIDELIKITKPSHEEVKKIAEEVYHITKREDSLENWKDAEIIACVLTSFHFFPNLKIKIESITEDAKTWAEPKLATLKNKIVANPEFREIKKKAEDVAKQAKEKLPDLYVSLLIKAVSAKGKSKKFLKEHLEHFNKK